MNRKVSVLCSVLALLAINIWISARLFRTEFTPFLDSTEGLYMALARWLKIHWAHPGWFPLWYAGIPIENAYPPVLPHLAALLSAATGMSAPRSVHALLAAFYCIAPAALFWLVLRLTDSTWKAFIAGWLYSLISLSAVLLPWTRTDATAWGPVRLFALLTHDEGAHIIAAALLFAALAAIHTALDHALGWRTVLAALASVSVVLTDWLGGVALVCGVVALLAARKRDEHKRPALGRLALIGLLASGIAAPWIPPSDIAAVRRNSEFLSGTFAVGLWQYVYLAAWFGGAFALGLLLKKTSVPEAARFAVIFLLLMAVPPLGWQYLKIYPLPQPQRYFLELDAAFAMLAGIILGSWRFGSKRSWSRMLVAVALVVLTIVLAPRSRREVRAWLPRFDITKTVEYEVAQYLNAHYPGQRVFVDGSTRYWFNTFADNPQLGGGADQGRSNLSTAHVIYAVPYTMGNGPDTVSMLKACGIRAVFVGGKHSRDVYPGYRDPAKFTGLVPEVWRDGDDAIYEIPGAGSLAHVVGKEALITTDPRDYPALSRYAAAIDADPSTRLVWNGPNRAIIEANLAQPQVLSVQISYDRGWRATANGAAVTPHKDALGFMYLEPNCDRGCKIELIYDGGTQGRVMEFLCILGCGACIWILYRQYRRA